MGKNKQMSPSLSATAVVTFSLRRNDGHADVDHLLPRGRRSGWNLFLLFVATGCHHEAMHFATVPYIRGWQAPHIYATCRQFFRNYEMQLDPPLCWQMCNPADCT